MRLLLAHGKRVPFNQASEFWYVRYISLITSHITTPRSSRICIKDRIRSRISVSIFVSSLKNMFSCLGGRLICLFSIIKEIITRYSIIPSDTDINVPFLQVQSMSHLKIDNFATRMSLEERCIILIYLRC